MRVVGLFAGIGGFELGLSRMGHHATHLVENAEPATAVLRARLDSELLQDVRTIEALPPGTELVVAGFPCQDLSSVGRKDGIEGARSSLVSEVFRLLQTADVPWVVLENVPFLLQLGRGAAMKLVTSSLERLGYSWAYRVIDSQAFGVPQRRRRWFLVASNAGDPRDVLLAGGAEPPAPDESAACGFYWTEGMRALGWAVDALPPIKGGSSVGVPSPPAIVLPTGEIVTPDLRDAERLQGFEPDWTQPAEEVARAGRRWQLVGNAVTVPVAEWIGERLNTPVPYDYSNDERLPNASKWPYAAWSSGRGVHASSAGAYPVWLPRPSLIDFLEFPTRPLSVRAARGFLARTQKGSLRFREGFLEAVRAHIAAEERRATDSLAA